MTIVAYARVSTTDQSLDVQLEQLRDAGAEKIFSEQKSGKDAEGRPALADCLDYLREGDVLIVTRLDRLGRSLGDLLSILKRVGEKGAAFRCIQQSLDTTTPEGRLMFSLLGAFAEFELDIRRARQMEGIAARKAKQGYKRTPKVPLEKIEALARAGWGPTQIGKRLGIDRGTVRRNMPSIAQPVPEALARSKSMAT